MDKKKLSQVDNVLLQVAHKCQVGTLTLTQHHLVFQPSQEDSKEHRVSSSRTLQYSHLFIGPIDNRTLLPDTIRPPRTRHTSTFTASLEQPQTCSFFLKRSYTFAPIKDIPPRHTTKNIPSSCPWLRIRSKGHGRLSETQDCRHLA